jgi:hypothetical protein
LNREQLHALLVEAKARIRHTDYVIVGSLAILGAVLEPPGTMVVSIDVDLYLKNDPQRTGELAEALGQGSPFEDEFGRRSEAPRRLAGARWHAGGDCRLSPFRQQLSPYGQHLGFDGPAVSAAAPTRAGGAAAGATGQRAFA